MSNPTLGAIPMPDNNATDEDTLDDGETTDDEATVDQDVEEAAESSKRLSE